ncbi:MAG: tRNA pseudouridine(38-40) synthase TruA [Candidatus Gastranaerophilales bacterium]|nr:tRNA pseudouridine(38-40) synthase TruA [Candidatus Gastranaerophilales bacterium]
MTRYAIVLEYDGKNYSGSQKQPNRATIQSTLEDAMKILFKTPIKTIFSGRTDAGVNSKGQVVHFDLPEKVETERLINSLNGILPKDISVNAIAEVDKTFHSQKKAVYRWYRYIINNSKQRTIWPQKALHIREKLDVDAMNKALSYLEGVHDFSGFKSANTENPAKECKVYLARCKSEKNVIYVDIAANRFLYNMIRVIVGTLLKIGQGQWEPEKILQILDSKDRQQAGKTVLPDGLFYMFVGYNEKINIEDNVNMEITKDENIFGKTC